LTNRIAARIKFSFRELVSHREFIAVKKYSRKKILFALFRKA